MYFNNKNRFNDAVIYNHKAAKPRYTSGTSSGLPVMLNSVACTLKIAGKWLQLHDNGDVHLKQGSTFD